MWSEPERAQELGRERARLEKVISGIDALVSGADDARELLELAEADADEDTVNEVISDLDQLTISRFACPTHQHVDQILRQFFLYQLASVSSCRHGPAHLTHLMKNQVVLGLDLWISVL